MDDGRALPLVVDELSLPRVGQLQRRPRPRAASAVGAARARSVTGVDLQGLPLRSLARRCMGSEPSRAGSHRPRDEVGRPVRGRLLPRQPLHDRRRKHARNRPADGVVALDAPGLLEGSAAASQLGLAGRVRPCVLRDERHERGRRAAVPAARARADRRRRAVAPPRYVASGARRDGQVRPLRRRRLGLLARARHRSAWHRRADRRHVRDAHRYSQRVALHRGAARPRSVAALRPQ